MPLSEHNESMASVIGVPIKKRRFFRLASIQPEVPSAPETPSVSPPSETPTAAPSETPVTAPSEAPKAAPSEAPKAAPSETPKAVSTSVLVKPELQVDVQQNLKQEGSSSNAGSSKVSTVISCFQEGSKDIPVDKNVNLVQGNVNPTGVSDQEQKVVVPSGSGSKIVQEPKVVVPSGSGSKIDSKGKQVLSDETALHVLSGTTELQLAPILSHPQQVKQEPGNEAVLRNDAPSVSLKVVNTELLLPEKKQVVPSAVVGQDSEEEKLDPCSWNLALTGGKSRGQIGGKNAESKIDGTNLRTNRSNWDLNTMMDTWDGSLNDSAIVSGVGGRDGIDASGKRDMKSVMSSKPDAVVSGKQILEKSEKFSKLSSFSTTPNLPQKTQDLLHLRLSTSNVNEPEKLISSSNSTLVASRIVKSELSDASNKQDTVRMNVSSLKPDHRIVKSEPAEGYLQESNNSSSTGSLKSVDRRNVKQEPVCRLDKETPRTTERSLEQPKINISNSEMPTSSAVSPHLGLPTCTTSPSTVSHNLKFTMTSDIFCGAEASCRSENMPFSGDVSQNAGEISGTVTSNVVQNTGETSCTANISIVQNAGETTGTDTSNVVQNAGVTSCALTSDLVSESVPPDGNESKVADDISCITRVDDSDAATNKLQIRSVGSGNGRNGMVAESDEEKLNISDDMQDDCSSGTDDEPDGPVVGDVLDSKGKQNGGEDDDYEDGEVRESSLNIATEGVGYPDASDYANGAMSDDMDISDDEVNVPFHSGNDHIGTLSNVEISDGNRVDPSKTKSFSGIEGFNNTSLNEEQLNAVSLNEPSSAAILTIETGQNELVEAQKSHLELTRIEDGLDGSVKELTSGGAHATSQGTTTAGDHSIEMVNQTEIGVRCTTEQTICTVLPKTEPLFNGAETTKDGNSGGNRSRIINLARAFNDPTFNRTRSMPDRSLPSRIEGERTNEIDRSRFRWVRDENCLGRGQKFERQRNRDQPVGSNNNSEFMHGRGRTDKNFTRCDWDSSRNFADDFNDSNSYRYSRPKNLNKVMVSRDVTVVGAGGRKQLTDELPSFRHPPGRRRSPGGREGAMSHGVRMVRRPQRNISPDRCIGGDDTNLIGLRREEKFSRGLPDDILDPVFSHPQARYQQVDNPFRRGDRSFSPIQRRAPLRVPRIRSKSPGTRPRSPGPWSSPRRRSPETFGRAEMIARRSPPFYRMERVRSPRQRPCFAEDVGGRRHGSPPYMPRISSDLREVDTVRDTDHPRAFIANRSPTGRVLPRGTRRFNMIESRERMENNEFFAGPLHPGRFHELEGDEGAEDRRVCPERRGPVRSFRPTYDAAAEVENFQFDVEAGPRPYIFSPEDEAEFHERGNLREREFERRVKTRPGNVPRRNRSIEEQEENYRNDEQGWHGAAFDDVSAVKRRRF